MRRALVIVLSALAFLAGCTTMSADECRAANWSDVGLRDGLEAKTLSLLNDRVKDCAEARVTVDTPRYLQGREQGLLQFCRIENAVPLGLNGKSYQGVCPPAIDPEFRHRYQTARDVFSARTDLRSLESRRATAEERLRNAGNDDERRRARDELRELDLDMVRARDRLRDTERALSRIR